MSDVLRQVVGDASEDEGGGHPQQPWEDPNLPIP